MEDNYMSDTQTPIYLELSPELQQLPNDNSLSVDDILRQQNIPAEVSYSILPDEPEAGARSKDPVMMILASAAVVLAVGAAISRVLHTFQRRPQLVEYYELVELKDSEGNILRDQKGKPQLKRLKKYELLEPRKEDSNQSVDIGLNTTNGLVIKFGSTEQQIGAQDKPKSA
jgi:hypothetical protein